MRTNKKDKKSENEVVSLCLIIDRQLWGRFHVMKLLHKGM